MFDYRPVGSRDLNLNQTEKPYFALHDLEPYKMYEFVVKSGNHYGMSIFTVWHRHRESSSLPLIQLTYLQDPLVITLRGSSQSAQTSLGNNLLKVFLGIGISAFLLIAVSGALFYYKRYYLPQKSQARGGVSFANPTYLKDAGTVQLQDHITISTNPRTTTEPNGNNKIGNSIN